jgi:hypothetical protein
MKVVRDVPDEQRGRRPIFNATLWAAAGWLFFRVVGKCLWINMRLAAPFHLSETERYRSMPGESPALGRARR